MNKPLLEVRDLKKYFPIYSGFLRKEIGAIKAVDGIDFTVYPGHVLAMVGESGSGKSTAGRAAIRLIEPTSGTVTFEGEDLLSFGPEKMKEVRRQIQIVFQDPYASLNPRRSVGESIGEGILYHGLAATKEEMIDQVGSTLRQVGLDPDAMSRFPHQFSGGQQQRICIGRAIALKPKLIICDEAVSALDVSVQAQILNLLMDLKESLNLSYLFISHDLSIVRHIADDVVVMHKGKLVESGPIEEIFHHPQVDYTKKLLSSVPIDHPRERK